VRLPETLLFAEHIETLARRADRALAACGFDTLVLHSGRPAPIFLDDQHYPFRAHAPFRAWVPLGGAPDCLLAVRRGERPWLVICTPEDYWHLPPRMPADAWTAQFELRQSATAGGARSALPPGLGRTAFIGAPFPELLSWGFDAINPEPLIRQLDFDRAAKTRYELACLREANRLAVRGHLAAARAFESGASELEIELAYLAACGQREHELPYNPIIALDDHAAVLHYQLLERQRRSHTRALLIDAGADHAGYASDVTRTWTRDRGDFHALIGAMDALQQRLCSAVRPGVDWRDVHLLACYEIAILLREADLLDASPEAALASGALTTFFPHGIGHLLGLQVHDVGGLQAGPEGGEIPRPEGHPFLRLTRRLEAGFVVTMEPGIYFIDSLLERARGGAASGLIRWSRVAALRPFGGIRIEDDLAVTASGHENLTRAAFASSDAGWPVG
jgi:Xaa-Pro dipeptidase